MEEINTAGEVGSLDVRRRDVLVRSNSLAREILTGIRPSGDLERDAASAVATSGFVVGRILPAVLGFVAVERGVGLGWSHHLTCHLGWRQDLGGGMGPPLRSADAVAAGILSTYLGSPVRSGEADDQGSADHRRDVVTSATVVRSVTSHLGALGGVPERELVAWRSAWMVAVGAVGRMRSAEGLDVSDVVLDGSCRLLEDLKVRTVGTLTDRTDEPTERTSAAGPRRARQRERILSSVFRPQCGRLTEGQITERHRGERTPDLPASVGPL